MKNQNYFDFSKFILYACSKQNVILLFLL